MCPFGVFPQILSNFQGQILAVWILAAKLPNSDLNFAVDFQADYFSLLFSQEKPCPSFVFFLKMARKTTKTTRILIPAEPLKSLEKKGKTLKKKKAILARENKNKEIPKTRKRRTGKAPKNSPKKSPAEFTQEFGRKNSPRISAAP